MPRWAKSPRISWTSSFTFSVSLALCRGGPLAFPPPMEVHQWPPALTLDWATPYPVLHFYRNSTNHLALWVEDEPVLIWWERHQLTAYTSRPDWCYDISQWLLTLMRANNLLNIHIITVLDIPQDGPGIMQTCFLAWCQHVCWGVPLSQGQWANADFRWWFLYHIHNFYRDSSFWMPNG